MTANENYLFKIIGKFNQHLIPIEVQEILALRFYNDSTFLFLFYLLKEGFNRAPTGFEGS